MTRRTLALAFALALLPRPSLAQSPPSEPSRAEAADRFDRGLRLFDAGDTGGALAEFRRAYELVSNPLVLYNIGLVYAQMGRAVEATDALDRVLAAPEGLSAERLARARRTRDEQAARIGSIALTVSVDGATVDLDGVEAGKTPLPAPLRVSGGPHIVGAAASGYAPLRKEVTVAGGQKQDVSLELVAVQGKLASLVVTSRVPAASVVVDGQKVGTTPLVASVTLAPGGHHVELRRPGYLPAQTDVVLGDGARGEVTLDPAEDAQTLASTGGRLQVVVSEGEAVVTIDGRPRGVYSAPIRLPPGPHHLLVEEGNFEPLERDFTVSPGATTTVQAALDPTPEYRVRYTARANTQRTWGLIGLIGGAVLLGGGVGLLVYDSGQRNDGQSELDYLGAHSARGSGGVCDPGQSFDTFSSNCTVPLNASQSKVDDANTRDYFAWSAVGVGGAALVTGAVLYFTANPRAYDRSAAGGLTPTFWVTHAGGGLGATWAW